MVVEILPAHSISGKRIRVIAPAEDAGLWEIVREEISEPVDAIFRCVPQAGWNYCGIPGHDA